MNNSTETQSARDGFISILKTDNKLKAVEIQKLNGNFTILWSKSTKENDLNWQAFAENCGLEIKTTQHEPAPGDKNVIIGYDSTGTAFYRVNVPAVEEKEISSIVRLQAESRFPLSADQMELAWRTSKLSNKQMAITIAAARKQTVHNFIDKIRFLNPTKAILDYEAIVKVWKEVFTGRESNAIIVNACKNNTQICLAEKGLLCTAVTLDIGTIDLVEGEFQEHNETLDRLVRDIRSVVDLFGLEKQFEMPVIVLSDGSQIYENLAESLQFVGLNASSSKPSLRKLGPDNKLDIKEIFEYRAPIGVALMGLDSKNDELNLFKYLFEHLEKEEKEHWYFSPKITSSIAAVLLLLFVIVSYAEIAGGSKVINNRLKNLGTETEINDLVEKQKLYQEVAKQRADLLALLNEVTQSGRGIPCTQNSTRIEKNPEEPNQEPKTPPKAGIELESFHFKRRSPVTITGKAQKNEQLEDFEKCLISYSSDIKNVHLTPKSSNGSSRSTSPKPNGKNSAPKPPSNPGGSGNKGIPFTVTFNYKDFSTSTRR